MTQSPEPPAYDIVKILGALPHRYPLLLVDRVRSLEIGKSGVWTSEQVRELDTSLEYHLYDMAALADADPSRIGALLARIAARFETGELEPLPHRVLAFDDAVDAFRLMAQGRHVGKIVLVPHRAGAMSVRDNFYPMAIGADAAKHFQGYLNSIVTIVMMLCVLVILSSAILRWVRVLNGTLKPAESPA